ncbi:MAG: Gfo/Idh/MocA family protein [Phycisphaeraceae bacterium]
MAPWRIMHVGCGKRGRGWVKRVQEHPDCRSVALVDPAEAAITATREAHPDLDAPAFGDIAEAVRQVEADIALIASAATSRRHDCETAAAHGLHALVEKPLALTLEDGAAIVAAAQAQGVHVVVGQNYRYKPLLHAMARQVDDGAIGAPGAGIFTRTRRRFGTGTYQQHMPHNYLWEMGVHDLDLIRYILGRRPLHVTGQSWLPPWGDFTGETTVQALLHFEDNITVNYFGAWASAREEHSFRVDGERGALRVDHEALTFTAIEDGAESTLAPSDTAGDWALMEELFDAVRHGTPPATSAADNLWTLGLLDAIQRATETGEKVAVQLPASAASGA